MSKEIGLIITIGFVILATVLICVGMFIDYKIDMKKIRKMYKTKETDEE